MCVFSFSSTIFVFLHDHLSLEGLPFSWVGLQRASAGRDRRNEGSLWSSQDRAWDRQ